MSLDVSNYKSGKDYGRVEDSTYPARLVQVIELGMQEQFDFQTKESKGFKPRVLLTFEFPTERIEFDEGESKPRWYSKEYTLSNHKMASIKSVLKALDPSGSNTNLANLVGSPCMVQIGSTSTGKAKITNVMPVVKGMDVPELENEPVIFDLDDPDINVWKNLPEWLKEKIKENKNFEGSKLDLLINQSENLDDDIPF